MAVLSILFGLLSVSGHLVEGGPVKCTDWAWMRCRKAWTDSDCPKGYKTAEERWCAHCKGCPKLGKQSKCVREIEYPEKCGVPEVPKSELAPYQIPESGLPIDYGGDIEYYIVNDFSGLMMIFDRSGKEGVRVMPALTPGVEEIDYEQQLWFFNSPRLDAEGHFTIEASGGDLGGIIVGDVGKQVRVGQTGMARVVFDPIERTLVADGGRMLCVPTTGATVVAEIKNNMMTTRVKNEHDVKWCDIKKDGGKLHTKWRFKTEREMFPERFHSRGHVYVANQANHQVLTANPAGAKGLPVNLFPARGENRQLWKVDKWGRLINKEGEALELADEAAAHVYVWEDAKVGDELIADITGMNGEKMNVIVWVTWEMYALYRGKWITVGAEKTATIQWPEMWPDELVSIDSNHNTKEIKHNRVWFNRGGKMTNRHNSKVLETMGDCKKTGIFGQNVEARKSSTVSGCPKHQLWRLIPEALTEDYLAIVYDAQKKGLKEPSPIMMAALYNMIAKDHISDVIGLSPEELLSKAKLLAEVLRHMARHAVENGKNKAIGDIVGGATTIVGGVMQIFAWAAAPFTSGASIGLHYLGDVISNSGSMTNMVLNQVYQYDDAQVALYIEGLAQEVVAGLEAFATFLQQYVDVYEKVGVYLQKPEGKKELLEGVEMVSKVEEDFYTVKEVVTPGATVISSLVLQGLQAKGVVDNIGYFKMMRHFTYTSIGYKFIDMPGHAFHGGAYTLVKSLGQEGIEDLAQQISNGYWFENPDGFFTKAANMLGVESYAGLHKLSSAINVAIPLVSVAWGSYKVADGAIKLDERMKLADEWRKEADELDMKVPALYRMQAYVTSNHELQRTINENQEHADEVQKEVLKHAPFRFSDDSWRRLDVVKDSMYKSAVYGTLQKYERSDKPKDPRLDDGVWCMYWPTWSCDLCKNGSSHWWGKGHSRCGKEPGWKDGTYCLAGTTCKACENSWEWWYSKASARCGKEPRWQDGTMCAAGTTCSSRCANSWEWWWSKGGARCGKEPRWKDGSMCAVGSTCEKRCANSWEWWYSKGGSRCGKEPRYRDGTLCAAGSSCNKRCANSWEWWYSKGAAACGKEARWGKGTYCFAGSSCKRCKETATWWTSKHPHGMRCGREPCWKGGSVCGAGTTCNKCCGGSHCPWYWFGVCKCK